MAKINEDNVIAQSLDQIMSDRFGRYSKYIIQDRALPDARDGLKPVQRRILFSMYELGLFYSKPFKKSARVVGDVIGKYHPHGDTSIYDALVRMSQDWKMNMPLVEMHGNNGSIDDDPAAAMRYTEARLEKLAQSMLDGIKKDTVRFAPNFDDSEKEPTVLPALVPNLLVNGAKGIASGYATEMPPHNLGEVIDAAIARIKSPNCRLETLLAYMKGPDFPTGGIVMGADGIYQAFERGRGKMIIRSKYELNTSKTKPFIRISETPYAVIKSKLVRQIDEIRFNKSIHGIKEVRDETDRNGTSIMIELNAGSDAHQIVNYLLAKTDLQVYYSYNNIAIKDRGPKLLSLSNLLDAYIKHQKEVHQKYIAFEYKKDLRRVEIVAGLIKVSGIAEAVIDVIRKAEGSKSGVIKALVSAFAFTELQANAIAELRLYRLSRTDQSIYIDEKRELDARLATYKELLNNEESLSKYIIDKLKAMKKEFAVPRKTQVEEKMEKIQVNLEDLIKHEESWVGISREGYIKRFSNRIYENNELHNYGLKDRDALVYLSKINTANKLLVFTSKGEYIFIPTHKIKEENFKSIGNHINDFAHIDAEDKIVGVIAVKDFKLNAFVTLVSKLGKAKRVEISKFEASRYSKALKAIKLELNDELIGADVSNGDKQLVIITSTGKAVKYAETNIATYGTKSGGVRAITLLPNVFVTAFALGSNTEVLGLISKRGGIKRIRMVNILPMSRTTQGKALYRTLKGNPHLSIDAAMVSPGDKACFKTAKNILQFFEMKEADITNSEAGFSAIASSQIVDAKIMIFKNIFKGAKLFDQSEELSEEDKFKEAEQALEKMSQLSIDDILKGY